MAAAGGIGPAIARAHAASTGPAPAGSGSGVRARAAIVPLAAMLVCSRVCPLAGGAAVRLIYRAPRQIRAVAAPKPILAQQFSAAAGSSPGQTLGLALARGNKDLARAMRARGFAAHHIVAHGHPRAEFARMVLQIHGVGPNSAVNGVWLRTAAHGGVHSNAYFHNVNRVLGKYYFNPFEPRERMLSDLQRVGKLLQAGQFPL
jgi:hypothetical protein